MILEKKNWKKPGDPVHCWLKCKQCSDLLSPASNVSRAQSPEGKVSHQKGCMALKRQAVHVPGSASCSVNQRLSVGAASGSGSGWRSARRRS